MQNKSETQNLFKSFIDFAYTNSMPMSKLLKWIMVLNFIHEKNHGIEYQCTYVYTSQQNDIVEHKYRYILTIPCALLFQSHLPLNFWGECISIIVYLINRLPSLLLSNKSPFVLVYSHSPPIDHLKFFGCLCYATIVDPT